MPETSHFLQQLSLFIRLYSILRKLSNERQHQRYSAFHIVYISRLAYFI